jgi:hypothetical protein
MENNGTWGGGYVDYGQGYGVSYTAGDNYSARKSLIQTAAILLGLGNVTYTTVYASVAGVDKHTGQLYVNYTSAYYDDYHNTKMVMYHERIHQIEHVGLNIVHGSREWHEAEFRALRLMMSHSDYYLTTGNFQNRMNIELQKHRDALYWNPIVSSGNTYLWGW